MFKLSGACKVGVSVEIIKLNWPGAGMVKYKFYILLLLDWSFFLFFNAYIGFVTVLLMERNRQYSAHQG